MATIQKRKNRYTATVRRKGFPVQTRTFATKKDAGQWARGIESQCDRGVVTDHTAPFRVQTGTLLKRYAQATASKRNAPRERHMLALLDREFGALSLAQLTRARVAEFRDKREAEGRAPSTIRNDLHLLSAMFQMAIRDWGYDVENPVRRIRMPVVKNARDRRLRQGEEKRLIHAAQTLQLRTIIVVAIESAMRLGEMINLTWKDVDLGGRTIVLRDTKNGDTRVVPLTKRAVGALAALRAQMGTETQRVFNHWKRPDSFSKGWHALLRRAKVEDLRFHDLRHEATSRMTEHGLSPVEVAAITGHRTMQMLKRYSHFSPQHLIRLLDKPAREGDDK